MNAINRLALKYSPSSIGRDDIEASQKAVKGYSFSRVRNAERVARLGAIYGTCGLVVGVAGWLTVWGMQPLKHDVHHWMIWDGVHTPFELPSMKIAIEQAPQNLNLYFAQQYVLYRERYYYDLFPSDRTHVSYQTGHEEMAEYNAATDAKNPDASIVDPGKNGFIEITPTGSDIEFNKETGRYHSKVYFTRRVQRYGAQRAPALPMLADFTWEKHPENVPENAHAYSPIGMVVIHYNRQKQGVTQ
jgi:type IV secretory pathway component VirB8